MMGNRLLDPKGRPMATIGPLEEDLNGNLAMLIVQK